MLLVEDLLLLLTAALATVRRREGTKPTAVIGQLGKQLRRTLYERLAAVGIVRAERDTVLRLFPSSSWPNSSVDDAVVVRRALVGALVQGAPPPTRA